MIKFALFLGVVAGALLARHAYIPGLFFTVSALAICFAPEKRK